MENSKSMKILAAVGDIAVVLGQVAVGAIRDPNIDVSEDTQQGIVTLWLLSTLFARVLTMLGDTARRSWVEMLLEISQRVEEGRESEEGATDE